MINAIIPIWKPVDWTSFDVVKKIRAQIKPAKVGHAGTLDPFAEGVLMLCTGEFTKKVESFMNKDKEYLAEIQLGIETDTLDLTGNIVKTASIPYLSQDQIEMVLKIFIGNIKQEPPMFSAIKVHGQPLYRFARKGINIPRKKRVVSIYTIQLVDFSKDIEYGVDIDGKEANCHEKFSILYSEKYFSTIEFHVLRLLFCRFFQRYRTRS